MENNTKKIAKNYISNLAYQILAIILPLITTPYISRILQPDGVGTYSYTFTVATLFSLFAILGTSSYGQREIAYNMHDIKKRTVVFWEIFFLRIITTFLVLFVYVIYSIKSLEYCSYLLAQSFILLTVITDISWFFQGIEKFVAVAVRNAVVKVISVIAIFLFVNTKDDLLIYILILSLSNFLSGIVMFSQLKNEICKISLSEIRITRHMKGTIEFFIPALAVQLYSHLDKIMLVSLTGSTLENGYYEQARKITELILRIITSLNIVLFSRVAFLYSRNNQKEISVTLSRYFRVVIFMLSPMALGLIAISDNFVGWFFGADYEPVCYLLKLSSFLLVFMCIGNYVGVQYLNPTGQQNTGTKIYIISAIINVSLNYMLIPSMLAKGAMIASIVAEACSCSLQFIALYKSKHGFKPLNLIWKYVLSAVIMSICIFTIGSIFSITGILLSVLQILIGIIVYFILLVILKDELMLKFVSYIRKAVIE